VFDGTNVGIGTSSPAGKLDVTGSLGAVQINASGNQIAYTRNGFNYLTASGAAAILTVQASGASGVVTINTAGSEALRVTNAQRVGIGTTAPAAKLQVTSATQYDGIQLNNGTYATAYIAGNTATNDDAQLTLLSGGVAKVSILANGDTYFNGGNVGIGTSSPNASAILDAQSTTKGVRFPNMTTTQKNAVSSPAAGLVVFDTTLAKLCVYSGSAWQTITSV
jgi:hypothetical protein